MTNTRTLTFPVLSEVKRMFRKCIGKPLTDDDRAMAAQFDVAKEIEKAKAIMGEQHMNDKPVYQKQSKNGDWEDVSFKEYSDSKSTTRTLFPAAAYQAQAKRIDELYDVANAHRYSYIAAAKVIENQKSEIEALNAENLLLKEELQQYKTSF